MKLPSPISDRIIVPLDMPTIEEAIALVEKLPQVSFWKVGLELFVSAGPEILKILKERQKRIFLDLKFHDIPNTVAGACRSASGYGVDFLTIHATAGRKALQAAVEIIGTEDSRPKLLAITLLTSLNSRELAFELKIPLELPEYALQMALLAKEAGLDGAVCSPQEVDQLRQICGNDFLFICPGVRPSWSQTGDQRRVMTPAKAMKAGADYLVIGRPITAATHPVEAWERICEELAVV
ncbi:MAG: orotidine-5'-phosphate decarboxylase [Xenococcaceae cyanobacterium]